VLRKRNPKTVAVQTSAGLQILDGGRRFILREEEIASAAANILDVLSRGASLAVSDGFETVAAELLSAGILEEIEASVPAPAAEVSAISVTRFSMGAETLVLASYGQFQLKRFRLLAETCYASGCLLLPAYCTATETVIGPLVVPGKGAGWNCARLRAIAASDTTIEDWALHQALLNQEIGIGFGGDRQASDWLKEEAGKIVSRNPTALQAGQVRIQDLVSGLTTTHDVLPLPGCTLCGGPWVTLPAVCDNAGLIDERFGIIRRVLYGTSDGATRMLPICARAIVSAHTQEKRGPLPLDDAFGKGVTKTDAFQSAVGEAVERYSESWADPGRLYRAPYSQVADHAFHPAWLTLYTEEQYDRPGFPYARFDPDQPMEWVRGLFHKREVWVPAIAVFQRYACAANEAICQGTSNGLAAGTSIADASHRALLELIERDAVLFSWYTRTPGRRILVSRADVPEIARMIDDVEALGASIELYRIDSRTPAYTVVCLGIGDGVNWPSCTVGFGADLDIHAATRKAVLEHGQIGPYFRRVLRENRDPIPARPEEIHTLQDHELYYLPAGRASAFDFFRSTQETATPIAEVPALSGSFEDLDVAFVDVTSPDLAATSYRVVRAVGKHFLPLYSGYGFERVDNPRLSGLTLNHDIPPIC
jgi:ribosomal protein S12 methylthiotransferase accessory factor